MHTTDIRVESKNNYNKLVTTSGLNCYYDIYSHPAPTMVPVMFVGGAHQGIASWEMFVHHYSRITTVVELDLPVPGVSEQLPIDYGFDDRIEALAKLLDAEHLDKVYLVLASYGKPVVYQFIRNYRDKRNNLIKGGVLRAVPETTRKNILASFEVIKENDIEQFIDMVLDGQLLESNWFY